MLRPPATDVPLPPDLPEPPPPKLQFNIKHLLAFMLATAFLATGIRYLLQYLEQLPDNGATGLVTTTLGSLAFGGLVYCLLRGPFLVRHFFRLNRRWRTVQSHRRDLEAWASARQQEKKRIIPEKAPPTDR